MSRKDNILSRQDPLLKFFVCSALVISSAVSGFNQLLIIFSFTLLHFLVEPIIFLHWLKLILKILPFFISLFILGILFNVSFIEQCHLSVRILYVLLISVYITRTSSIDAFAGYGILKRSKFIQKLFFFLAATIYFIPIFVSKFEKNRKMTKNLNDIVINSMEDCVTQINDVEAAVMKKFDDEIITKQKFSLANIYFLVLILPLVVLYLV